MSRTQLGAVSRSVAAALVLAIATTASPVRADDKAAEPIDGDTGIGIAAGLASLVYTPAKILYAIGGGVAAGMAYVASAGNQDVTEPILTPSVRGDYIVTPAHLRGQKSLEFFGREPEHAEHAKTPPPVSSGGDGLDSQSHSAATTDDTSSTE